MLEVVTTESLFTRAKACAAPEVVTCFVIGDGATTKLVFMAKGADSENRLQAVALTHSQMDALVGMLTTHIDSGDPEAVGMF